MFLGFADSGSDPRTAGTPGSFSTVPVEHAAARLADVLREEQADVLTAYDRHGGYGHPDHVQVHRVGVRAGVLAGTPAVLEATVSRELLQAGVELARSMGHELGEGFQPDSLDAWYLPEAEITTVVDVRDQLDRKRAAMRAHASQATSEAGTVRSLEVFAGLPDDLFALAFAKEWFVRRSPAVAGTRRRPVRRAAMTEPELVPEAEAVRTAAHDADVAAEQRLVPKAKRKSNLRWVIEIAITLSVLVGMFVVILPRITGSSYEEVWEVLGAIEPWELLLLVAVWIGNLWTYTPVLTNSLPGLTHPQAFTANLATSAVSNVLPFGGAVGVGATYLMYGSWGFSTGEITRSVLVTGVWNVLVKMALPVVALVLLTITGEARPAVAGVAVLGLAILAGTIAVLWLVLRSDAFAGAVGRVAGKVLSWLARLIRRPPVSGLEEQLIGFRHESSNLIARALAAAERVDRDLQRHAVRPAAAVPVGAARTGAPPGLGGGLRRLHRWSDPLQRVGHPEWARVRRGRDRGVPGGRGRRSRLHDRRGPAVLGPHLPGRDPLGSAGLAGLGDADPLAAARRQQANGEIGHLADLRASPRRARWSGRPRRRRPARPTARPGRRARPRRRRAARSDGRGRTTSPLRRHPGRGTREARVR